MQRRIVQIAKMCLADVHVGDAVGSDPNGQRGWFVVEDIVTLTNGHLSLVGDRGRSTITAAPRDIVGIQVRQAVEMAVEAPEGDETSADDAEAPPAPAPPAEAAGGEAAEAPAA